MLRHLLGYGQEKISDTSFRVMSVLLRLRDIFVPVINKVKQWDIKEGDTVVDFGCGPGSYIPLISKRVGAEGKVYAVDVHRLAIEKIKQKIDREKLKNVVPVLAERYPTPLADNEADLIYAMDMFHMVKDATAFLRELWRIIKPSGILLLESGHQPRHLALQKLEQSEVWALEGSTGPAFRCRPRGK